MDLDVDRAVGQCRVVGFEREQGLLSIARSLQPSVEFQQINSLTQVPAEDGAFAFGLVHGLGFAGALAELASGRIDLLALAAFNVGIEAAQVAIAAAAVPLIWWLFRSLRSERVGVPLASLSVACIAAVWVSARLAG